MFASNFDVLAMVGSPRERGVDGSKRRSITSFDVKSDREADIHRSSASSMQVRPDGNNKPLAELQRPSSSNVFAYCALRLCIVCEFWNVAVGTWLGLSAAPA